MPLAQTITVLNKSGKVVSTSKHLVSVWKEAKAAYLSRRAELHSKHKKPIENQEAQARKALKNVSLSDEHLPRHGGSSTVRRSRTTSKRHERSRHEHQRTRSIPGLERGYTDSVVGTEIEYRHPSEVGFELPDRGLVRRNSTGGRPGSSSSYDEHLAYGEMPPPLPLRPTTTENELRVKMSTLNRLLVEADCLQYTATSTIEHLQKNPDALAAVALSLAEISAMATKLGPAALTGLKAAFPAVVALLLSPEFLIAGGVAVGVTIVMLGGYKIIKRIQRGKKEGTADNVTQLREIEGDLSRIEMWRRGIAEAESSSVGTSVEGEFITPLASRRLIEDGLLDPEQVVSPNGRRAKTESSKKHRKTRSEGDGTETGSRRAHRSRAGGSTTSRRGENAKVVVSASSKRKKAVSGIRMLFGKRLPSS